MSNANNNNDNDNGNDNDNDTANANDKYGAPGKLVAEAAGEVGVDDA